MNLNFARQALKWLEDLGVQELLLCAGARNAPLIYVLKEFQFHVASFFEERSAGFYALGRIASSQKPVAVITTSGTAVAELLPAVIEAYFQCRPLIVVSADRPKAFRNTGAPQSIEQAGLFGSYVERCMDLHEGESPGILSYSFQRPLHLNLCFPEPLLSGNEEKPPVWSVPERRELEYPHRLQEVKPERFENPLVIAGELLVPDRDRIAALLQTTQWDCYLEASSQISGEGVNFIEHEKSIRRDLKQGRWSSVIRFGSVPTCRIWRDLEDLELEVHSFSQRPFTGLSRSRAKVYPMQDLEKFEAFLASEPCATESVVKTSADSFRQKLEGLLSEYPDSEPSWVYRLFRKFPEHSRVYLGNSLPIREWDLVWDRKKRFEIFSHRGANGIDGQVSGFLGIREKGKYNFALLGDLTTLYDLSGFWASQKDHEVHSQIYVINNGGGQIFSRMFDRPEFLNSHRLSFAAIAEMWGWNYLKLHSEQTWETQTHPTLIEIQPDEGQTRKFWRQWEQL